MGWLPEKLRGGKSHKTPRSQDTCGNVPQKGTFSLDSCDMVSMAIGCVAIGYVASV